MEKNQSYSNEVMHLALPVTAQCIFQSSLSFTDQLMVGQLGSISIAGSGLGGKFTGLYAVTLSAVAAAASILISQYSGSRNREGIGKSLIGTSYIAVAVMLLFTLPGMLCPEWIMHLYTKDVNTYQTAAMYLRIISFGFPAICGTSMLSALLRSMKQTKYPMYTSILATLMNLAGNYFLIFGTFGFPELGLKGAAIATTISRYVELLVLFCLFLRWNRREHAIRSIHYHYEKKFIHTLTFLMAPILLNEFLWSLGENVYAGIYGRMSTDDLAAMTLTSTMIGLFVGLFSGVATAAQVMVGSRLGGGRNEEAYQISKRLIRTGFFGSVLMGMVLSLFADDYAGLFQVSQGVRQTTIYLIYAFSILLFSKVCNMILGGGILRSGGNTTITLVIDLIGTWIFGIPLGLFTAFYLKQPIYVVYFVLSLEECIRFFLGGLVFRSRKWMKNVTKNETKASLSLREDEEFMGEKGPDTINN